MANGDEGFVLAALALGGLAAAGVEAWLVRRRHPRRHVYAWLMWTPLGAMLLAAGMLSSGVKASLAFVLTLLLAPLIYPIASVMLGLHLRMNPSARQQAWEDSRLADYRPVDFVDNADADRSPSTAAAPPPPLRGPPPP